MNQLLTWPIYIIQFVYADTDLLTPPRVRQGDSSVFVLSRTGHFEYSPVHNSVNINGKNFIWHLP